MKQVNASILEVRKKPSEPGKVRLTYGTIVTVVGPPVTYKHESWSCVRTISEPIIKGYVITKYLSNIYERRN